MFPAIKFKLALLSSSSLSRGCGFPECVFGCVRRESDPRWLAATEPSLCERTDMKTRGDVEVVVDNWWYWK